MPVRIGVNGLGRIGRAVLKLCALRSDVEVVAVNDIAAIEVIEYLIRHDSVRKSVSSDIFVDGRMLIVKGNKIRIHQCALPDEIPWREYGVDVVIESTGRFAHREGARLHLAAGARKVVVSAPVTSPDITILPGLNEKHYRIDDHHIISMGSCTANCLAPLLWTLEQTVGIQQGFMTTVHSYTNDQPVHDAVHNDLRRARAAALNMVPTTTGALKAVFEVMPALRGRIEGISVRVPVPDVSCVDLVVRTQVDIDRDLINNLFRTHKEGQLAGVMACTDDPLVSIDFRNNPFSSVVDLSCTVVTGRRMAKIFSWYDNEWGYSNRLVELLPRVAGIEI